VRSYSHRKFSRLRRRRFTLIEVVVSLFLVVLCLIPLLQPHAVILMEEKRFVREVQLDRVANLVYAEVLQSLYAQAVSWEEIQSGGRWTPMDSDELERLGYVAEWRVKLGKGKENKEEGNGPEKFFLVETQVRMAPLGQMPLTTTESDAVDPKPAHTYTFWAFLEWSSIQIPNSNLDPEPDSMEQPSVPVDWDPSSLDWEGIL
jgi:hypothetical protein